MPKIAALFSGQVREMPPSIFNKALLRFFKSLDVDFYLAYWDEIGESMAHSNVISPKKSSLKIENYIVKAFSGFNIKSRKIFDFEEWESNLNGLHADIHFDKKDNSYITKNSLPQLYLIEECYNLIENIDDYDYFFRLRFDNLMTLNLHDSELKEGIYNLNFGNAFYPNRIYDIFFMASKEYASSVMRTYSRIPKIYNLDLNNGLENRDACNLLYKSVINEIKTPIIESFDFRYTDVFRPKSGLNNYISFIFYCYAYNGNFIKRVKVLFKIASNFPESNRLNIILGLINFRLNLIKNLIVHTYKKFNN